MNYLSLRQIAIQSILLKARHDELIHELINLLNHELILWLSVIIT